jgi:hypothetical protein
MLAALETSKKAIDATVVQQAVVDQEAALGCVWPCARLPLRKRSLPRGCNGVKAVRLQTFSGCLEDHDRPAP